MLERIELLVGGLRAFDGRYCVWALSGVFDVRDIAARLKVKVADVIDAIPDFKPAKRGRASLEDSTSVP